MGDCIQQLKINSWKVGGRGGAAKQDYLYGGELSLCPNPAQSWEAANWEQPAQEAAWDKKLSAAAGLQGLELSSVLPIMDCSFPFSSATQRSLQQDKEQPDQQRCARPPSPRTERSVAAQQSWVGRTEPLQCQDLLVQNALFSGDLEMVQKFFTRSAAINLIIETRSEELRWTSKKFGGCAEWER